MNQTTITMDEYGRVAVPSDTANVWMSEIELVSLFGVIAPTLRAAIRAVYKSGVLQPCEVESRVRLPNGYYAQVYALPIVVALAFRINTPNAARVRKGTQRPVGKAVLAKRKASAVALVRQQHFMQLLAGAVACQYARAFTQCHLPEEVGHSASSCFFLFAFG